MRLSSLLFASVGIVSSAWAAPTIESRFDAPDDVEGWTTLRIDTGSFTPLGVPETPAWEAGHLLATETTGGLFTLSAPTAFLGDKSAYFGGSVSYDFSDATADPGPNLGFFLVKSDLTIALGYLQTLTPGTTTSFTVPLKADGNWFRYNGTPIPSLATDADIQSALGSLGYLGINADWTTATTDVTTLDNVVLAPVPVPEPATLAALGLGVAGFTRRRRAARRR